MTLGWFLVLALWHALANPRRPIISPVALALLVVAGLVAARTAAGSANAWVSAATAWQWAALPVVFIVVGQLAGPPNDSRGLFAVIVATGVSALFVHIAPLISWIFRVPWPTDFPDPNWTPTGMDVVTASGSGFRRADLREMAGDLFWFALAAPAAIFFGWRSRVAPFPRDRMLAWAPLAMLLVGLAAQIGQRLPPLPASWGPAVRMVASAPAGVGPGLYDRYAARLASPGAEVVHLDPPNSYLGLAATAGVVTLIALLAAMALAYRDLRRPRAPDPAAMRMIRPHWDLHIGGMIGILGGAALQAFDWPGAEPPFLALGLEAVIRAAAWFVTFMIAENCLLMEESDSAMGMGLAAAALAAVVGDVLRPEFTPAFWAAAALALNLVRPPADWPWAGTRFVRLAAIVAAASLLLGFAFMTYAPAISAAIAAHSAARSVPLYASKLDVIRRADGPAARAAGHSEAARYVRRQIAQPLTNAAQAAPIWAPAAGHTIGDLAAASALWWAAVWDHNPAGDPDALAIATARAGQRLDAESAAGFLAEFHARLRFAEKSAHQRTEHLAAAESLIPEIVRREPSLEARLRFRLANAYFAAEMSERGLSESRAAEQLDHDAPGPRYRLTDAERSELKRRLADGR
mgnify:FL=1